MSHFYGIIDNFVSKTQSTRRGFKNHGISSVVKSWTSRCNVYLSADRDTEQDVYNITIKGDNIKQVFLNGKVVKLG
jgi:hypothetical protein